MSDDDELFEPIPVEDLLGDDSEDFELISEGDCLAEGCRCLNREHEGQEYWKSQEELQRVLGEISECFGAVEEVDENPEILIEGIQKVMRALGELQRALKIDADVSERLLLEHIETVRRFNELLCGKSDVEQLT
jgi:hypothetical protein